MVWVSFRTSKMLLVSVLGNPPTHFTVQQSDYLAEAESKLRHPRSLPLWGKGPTLDANRGRPGLALGGHVNQTVVTLRPGQL